MNNRQNCPLDNLLKTREMKITDNEEMQQELEKQLHEQYAINNNANLGSIIVLLTALIAVFGAYGYIYLHSSIEFAANYGELYKEGYFSLDALLLSATAVFCVLVIMYRLCLYQGTQQRKEQFITYAIRHKYYGNLKEITPKIFSNSYHPFDKEDKFVQGIYGELLPIFRWSFGIIACSVCIKLIDNICKYYQGTTGLSIWVSLGVFLASIITSIVLRHRYSKEHRKQYKKQEQEFANIRPK